MYTIGKLSRICIKEIFICIKKYEKKRYLKVNLFNLKNKLFDIFM